VKRALLFVVRPLKSTYFQVWTGLLLPVPTLAGRRDDGVEVWAVSFVGLYVRFGDQLVGNWKRLYCGLGTLCAWASASGRGISVWPGCSDW